MDDAFAAAELFMDTESQCIRLASQSGDNGIGLASQTAVMGDLFLQLKGAGETDQHRRHADETVEHGDQFRHTGHLDLKGQADTDGGTDDQRRNK